ncbi:MAG TPA: DUF3857 and transglutaminase domain-containing protein [Blastocatellia bacterium]|nr:DUF3857 and transglutaminase domain-containing protein [Blastocatellia bacterium]
MLKRLLASIFLMACLQAVAAAKGDDTPAWLRQAASITVPTYDKDVHAVTLHDESRKTVEEDGRITTVTSYAVRILTREGRRYARASEGYNNGTGKVKDMRAWLVRPSGEVRAYGKKEIMDAAQVDNDIYNEARVKIINAEDEADAGCVFGYEIVTEEREVHSQFVWSFQALNPVVMSRVTVALPQGWRAEAVTFNHDKIEPAVSGNSYAWELRDLPAIEIEPASPVSKLVPRLAVNIFPPQGKATMLRSFADWKDVSRYNSELSDPQAAFNEQMAARARELTAGAKTEFERIQAISRYAQSVNYISIQIDLGRGGGYRPHAAVDVFNKNYGDCKDKANLMRAMLKALGVESYPVIIYSGDPNHVTPEWPSPQQFNHCIIAVKVSDETQASTIVKHPSLGRLLIFDPTDDDTPIGDLPGHEQGSYALIVAGDAGELMKMPVMPPEANRLERVVEAELDAEGSLTAKVSERSVGQAAVGERRLFKRAPRPQYLKYIEQWVTKTAPSANLLKSEPNDYAREGKFALDVEFKSPNYAQLMRGRLMIFKPAVVSRRSSLFLFEPKRKHPVVLNSEAYNETVRIKLPEGFDVDEMPDPTEISRPFGSYSAKCEVKEGHLLFRRSMTLKAGIIPIEQYASVRGFFEKIRAVEQTPVVLVKK